MLRRTKVLQKWRSSQSTRVSIKDTKEALFNKVSHRPVSIKSDILIQKENELKSLDDLFIGYDDKYSYCEIATGTPVGDETW